MTTPQQLIRASGRINGALVYLIDMGTHCAIREALPTDGVYRVFGVGQRKYIERKWAQLTRRSA